MMEFTGWLLFESVAALLFAEAIVFAVVLAVHRRRMTAGSKRAVWIALVACAAMLGLQWLVKTDREQIEFAVTQMAQAIDSGDVATVGEYLDRDFRDRGLDKASWLADLRQRLQRWQIDEAKIGSFSAQVDGDNAVASFSASCDWRGGQQNQSSVTSSWKLAFVRRDDGWKLSRVVKATFGPGGILDYATILQY